MKTFVKTVLVSLVVLVIVLLVNTFRNSAAIEQQITQEKVSVNVESITQHMSQAIQFQTISTGDQSTQIYTPFQDFIAWMQQTYSQVYSTMHLKIIAEHTILLKWQGSEADLKPIMLTAHYDVVPVVPGSESEWQHQPFSGDIADGYIWGRGALDDKSGVIAMLEAATLLIQQGFIPKRTIYFSFGHDEEAGGNIGASGVAKYLKEQGIQLDWTIDEGSFVLDGIMPDVDIPVASINVSEKGMLTLALVAHGPGGHSSMPEAELATDILAQALVNLRMKPLLGGLEGVSAESFDILAPHLPFGQRVLMSNRWLFGALVESALSKNAKIDALMRTTTAPTMLRAGIKANVIPATAEATINFRLHPRDSVDDVIAHVTSAINDERVDVKISNGGMGTPASAVSSRNSEGFKRISRVVRQIYGNIIVIPGMTMAATDSRHYSKVADNSYRINLMKITSADISGFHGKNERISIDNLVNGTSAYYLLMKQSSEQE